MTNKFKISVAALALAFVAFTGAHKALAAYTHTVTLKMGMTNSQVMSLQQTLNMTTCKVATSGAGSTGMESMYFGSKTKAAVQCFQALNGLSADGVVGAMTGAKLAAVTMTSTPGTYPAGCTSNTGFSTTTGASCATSTTLPAGCTSTVGYSSTTGAKCDGGTTSGALTGGAGSLDDVSKISSYSSEQVNEGDTDTKVAGFDIKADTGSDLAIQAFDINLSLKSGSGSDKLSDYVNSVSIWQGSTKLATVSASDFTKNNDGADTGSGNDYQKNITLSANTVKAGQTSSFYVTVTAQSNIDSADLDNNTWMVTLNSLRFRDASGAVISDSSTGDIGASVDFDFESLTGSGDKKIDVALTSGQDAINLAHIVSADNNSHTNDVPLLAFDLKATGAVKNVQDIPITVIATGTGDVNEIASGFSLWMDGTQIDTVDVADGTADNYDGSVTEDAACAGDSCAIHFDDVDFDMNDGSTHRFVVKADINDVDGTIVAEGDSLTAEITTTAADAIDAEDANGDSFSGSDISGSAVAGAVAFRSTGVMVTLKSQSFSAVTNTSGVTTQATYTMVFDVTAFGDNTLYFGTTAQQASTGSSTNAMAYTVENSAGTTITTTVGSGNSSITTTASTSGSGYILNPGDTKTVTLTVTLPAAYNANTDGYYRIQANQFRTFTDSALSTGAVNTTLTPAQSFESANQYLNL